MRTRQWLSRQWEWLAPRTLPLLVATMGLVFVVASGRYLSRFATRTPAPTRTVLLDAREAASRVVSTVTDADGTCEIAIQLAQTRIVDVKIPSTRSTIHLPRLDDR
jgi:hypothetical protein